MYYTCGSKNISEGREGGKKNSVREKNLLVANDGEEKTALEVGLHTVPEHLVDRQWEQRRRFSAHCLTKREEEKAGNTVEETLVQRKKTTQTSGQLFIGMIWGSSGKRHRPGA